MPSSSVGRQGIVYNVLPPTNTQLMSINDHMDEVQMIELFYSMEKVLEAKLAAHQEQGTAKVGR